MKKKIVEQTEKALLRTVNLLQVMRGICISLFVRHVNKYSTIHVNKTRVKFVYKYCKIHKLPFFFIKITCGKKII